MDNLKIKSVICLIFILFFHIVGFGLYHWRRLLRVPWTTGRSNQSILKNSTLTVHGRTDAKAKASILWLPDVKSQLIGKDPDSGKD